MAGGLVLALDVGTSTIKAGLFETGGAPVRIAAREQPLSLPGGGRAEQEPNETWRLLAEAVREAVRDAAGEVAALALSCQRGSAIGLDRAGEPLTPLLVWMDRRGERFVERLQAEIGNEAYYRIAGHPIVPYTGVSKALWLDETLPEGAVIAPPQTELLRRLGAEELVCDESLGTYLFPFEIERKRWSEELAARLDFPLERLPRLVSAVEVVGTLGRRAADDLGLRPGVALVAGGGDGQCAGAGCGVVRPGLAMVNVGTGAGVQAYLPRPLLDPLCTLNCAAHVDPRAWELEGHTQASGAALRWLRDSLGGGERYDTLIEQADAVPAGADGLLFLPTLNGSSAPVARPGARGALLGLSLAHRRAHVVRAVLEGISLELRTLLDAIVETGVAVGEIRLGGGGARSPSWNRIHAAALGRPLRTLAVPDLAAVGAAMCAAVGAGVYASLGEAAERFVRLAEAYEPDPAHAPVYEELLARYREAVLLLDNPARP